jgi:hypothetical protein
MEDLEKKIPGVLSPIAPKSPKIPSLAPTSQKSAIKQAEQLDSVNNKKLYMKQAKTMESASKNPMGFAKAEDEQLFHVIRHGQRITNDPMSASKIEEVYGNKDKMTKEGYETIQVKREKLVKESNGQWSLQEY